MKPAVRRPRKRTLIVVLVALAITIAVTVVLVAFSISNSSTPTPSAPDNAANQPDASPKETRIHVAAMGDMLAHDTIIANAQTPSGYDFGKYFTHIRPLYKDADVVFCNQEGLSAGPAFGISGYPSFNAPTEFAAGLQAGGGCNLINLANNHMGDKGTAATDATVAQWESRKPLAYAGANRSVTEQNTVRYFDVKGITISFLAFADFNNNRATPAYSVNNYHDQALVTTLVTEARKNSDIVLVSMHWGTEDSPAINADQRQQVSLLSSLGVDMIIGTGPHVMQPVETVARSDGKPMTIWYSLGNMLSSQLNIPELFSGIAGFDIVKQPTGGAVTIENLTFIPTYMHYEWSAADQAQNNLLARYNAMLYPLSAAAEPLSKTRLNTTVQAQQAYITDLLGPLVKVQ